MLRETLKQLGKRWFICVVFGFDLLILVALSEAVRNIFVGLSPNTFDLGNWLILFFWIFLLVPLFLLPLWYVTPYAIRKLLVTFGLSEESPIAKKKSSKKIEKKMEKDYSIILSKKFVYPLIGTILIILTAFVIYATSLGNEMAARFLPTLFGLLFSFAFFTVLFELREFLEWKKVENRVKWRIGWEIYGLFGDMLNLCEVERLTGGTGQDLSAWKDAQKCQLEQLRKGKIVLSGLGKQLLEDSKLAESYASILNNRKNSLSNFEGKYSRYLSSKIQCSLMDIQVEVERILMELWRSEFLGTKDADRLTKSIEKIISEIANLSENGIGIGF